MRVDKILRDILFVEMYKLLMVWKESEYFREKIEKMI